MSATIKAVPFLRTSEQHGRRYSGETLIPVRAPAGALSSVATNVQRRAALQWADALLKGVNSSLAARNSLLLHAVTSCSTAALPRDCLVPGGGLLQPGGSPDATHTAREASGTLEPVLCHMTHVGYVEQQALL
jgi:hypothetical protein